MVLDGRQTLGDGGDGGNGEIQLQRRNFNGQENSGGGVTKPGTENKGELGGQVQRTHKNCREVTFGPIPVALRKGVSAYMERGLDSETACLQR